MKYQKITKVSKISKQKESEKVTNEKDKEILKKDIYLQEKVKKSFII